MSCGSKPPYGINYCGASGKDYSLQVQQSLLPTFSFDTRGAKEKVIKKKTPRAFRALRSATKGAAFGFRKLLKKLDQNFS